MSGTRMIIMGPPGGGKGTQAIGNGGFTVACGDGRCLDITEWSGADTPPALHAKLRTHP